MDGAESQEYFIPDSQEYYLCSSQSKPLSSAPDNSLLSEHASAPGTDPVAPEDDDYMSEIKRGEGISMLRSEKVRKEISGRERMPKLVGLLIQNLENSMETSIRFLFYDEFKEYT